MPEIYTGFTYGSSSSSGSSSTSSGSSYGYSTSDKKENIKKKVKQDLGLTAVGGLGGNNQGYIAANAPNPLMYGGMASDLTKEHMAKAGFGTYNADTGSFTNIVGNTIIGGTNEMMYGSSGAMGSGDPGGILSSVPISNKMLQSQNKLKGAILGIAGIAAGGNPAGLIMRGVGAKSLADAYVRPDAAYDTYSKKFKAKQTGKPFTEQRNLLGLLGLQNEKKTKKDTLG
jgi:hypothetical protein